MHSYSLFYSIVVPFQPNIVGVSVPTVGYNVSTVFVTWSIGSPEVCLVSIAALYY